MPKNPGSGRTGNSTVSHANIFMSIKQEHMTHIANGTKNHEYRRYLLPSSVQYIWFYTNSPISAIQYVARISRGKAPGEVSEDGGLGNEDFNAGKKSSKFGYEILALWKLERPITLHQAKSRGFLKGPPQKYTYVPKQVCSEWELDTQIAIMEKHQGVEDDIKEKNYSRQPDGNGEPRTEEAYGKLRITDFFCPQIN